MKIDLSKQGYISRLSNNQILELLNTLQNEDGGVLFMREDINDNGLYFMTADGIIFDLVNDTTSSGTTPTGVNTDKKIDLARQCRLTNLSEVAINAIENTLTVGGGGHIYMKVGSTDNTIYFLNDDGVTYNLLTGATV